MKIGVITYHRAYNYGSALQTYALNYYLRSLGHEAEVIDYHTSAQAKLYDIFEKPCSMKAIARNLHSLLYYKDLIKHKENFEAFIKLRVVLSRQKNLNYSDLVCLNNYYLAFICGSDQIWNPQCNDFSRAYLLDFVKDKRSCIAYAPSIGTDTLPEDFERVFSYSVRDFNALSLREKCTIHYLTELTDREIVYVPDPVLLISKEKWLDITPPRLIKAPYILCYFIGDISGMRAFAHFLYRKTGYTPVVINKNLRDIYYTNQIYYSAGPEEFLSFIRYSEYICTNSYHAVLFSLLYQKKFWVFTNSDKKSAQSRIQDILSVVDLTNRIINSNDPWPKDPTKPINFEGTAEILAGLAYKGKCFLQQTLGSIYEPIM